MCTYIFTFFEINLSLVSASLNGKRVSLFFPLLRSISFSASSASPLSSRYSIRKFIYVTTKSKLLFFFITFLVFSPAFY